MTRGNDDNAITRLEQLPTGFELISHKGEFEVREEDRRSVALLSVGKSLLFLWTGDHKARPSRRGLEAKIARAERSINKVMVAPSDLIQSLYNDRSLRRREITGGDSTDSTKMVDDLLTTAHQRNVSDIHILSNASGAEIVFRELGGLVHYKTIDAETMDRIGRTLHALGGDGKGTSFQPYDYQKFSVSRFLRNKKTEMLQEVGVRVQTHQSAPRGYDMVMRLLALGGDGKYVSLRDLGFAIPQDKAMELAVRRPIGSIVACGPTGSGKTTALKSLMDRWLQFTRGERKLITIEDPVELIIKGARQIPVGSEEGGYAEALKAVLRADPDAIGVGEIRDDAVAREFMHGVQTGHKVFTTVHAMDPVRAIERLIELGVARSEIAAGEFVNAILHQRLVPVLCPSCSIPLELKDMDDPILVKDLETDKLHKHVMAGRIKRLCPDANNTCQHCEGRGRTGRTAIAEILIPDTEILRLIQTGQSSVANDYWRSGLAHGDPEMVGKTIYDHLFMKLISGTVDPRDAALVTGSLVAPFSQDEHKESYNRSAR